SVAAGIFDLFLSGSRTLSEKSTVAHCLLFLLCAGATVVNPYGVDLHASILELGHSSFFMNLHVEWKSIDFKNPEASLLEYTVIFIMLSLFMTRGGARRLSWFDLLLPLSFVHLALG